MKVKIGHEELWEVILIEDHHPGSYDATEVELPEEVVERYRRALVEFNACVEILTEALNKARS